MLGAETGIPEALLPLDLPLCSIGGVSLRLNGTVNSIRWMDAGAPDVNVWALVSGANVLGEVVLAWNVGSDLHPQGRWHLKKSKMTARSWLCLAV